MEISDSIFHQKHGSKCCPQFDHFDVQKIEEEQMEYLGWIQLQPVDQVGDQAVAEAAT